MLTFWLRNDLLFGFRAGVFGFGEIALHGMGHGYSGRMKRFGGVVAGFVAALLLAPIAPAATTVVRITSGGFSPSTVSIVADDTIVWRNADTVDHQVVATSGAFASPVLRPGRTYAFTFAQAGRYDYRDALYPKRTGVVRVAGPPPALALNCIERCQPRACAASGLLPYRRRMLSIWSFSCNFCFLRVTSSTCSGSVRYWRPA